MEPISSGTNRTGAVDRQQAGAEHEAQARRYLEQQGLRFVACNVRIRGGETDLIMQDGDCWVFVEVRYRRNDRFGGAAASVTRHKQQKLLRAAALWLATKNASFDTVNCRFDVVAFTGSQLSWLPDAFNAES